MIARVRAGRASGLLCLARSLQVVGAFRQRFGHVPGGIVATERLDHQVFHRPDRMMRLGQQVTPPGGEFAEQDYRLIADAMGATED